MGRHLSTGGTSTESDTEAGEEDDSGQQFTPRGTPIMREMRAASLHTIMTVAALEAEGKLVEAAELLAAQLEHLKAIADGETGGRPEMADYGGNGRRRAVIDYGGDGGDGGDGGGEGGNTHGHPGLGEKQGSFPDEGTVNNLHAMLSPRFAASQSR